MDIGKIGRYLAMCQDESLSEHDEKYHGGHFDAKTMSCGKRDGMEKEDDVRIPADAEARSEGGTDPRRGFRKVKPAEFRKAIEAARGSLPKEIAWRVDVKTEEEYGEQCKVLRVSEGGSCYAVKKNGDIVSVCRNANDMSVRGRALMAAAVADGGDRLDTYDGNFGFYTKCGFRPVSWTPWNGDYEPDGYKEAKRMGIEVNPEHVVFFAKGRAIQNRTAKEWEEETPAMEDRYDAGGNFVVSGYELAEEARDRYIGEGSDGKGEEE